MRSEDVVPIDERYLSVQGHLSTKAQRLVRKGLPKQLPPNSRICFVTYAYANLPLPKEFDTLFRYNRDETFVKHGDDIGTVFQPKHLATAIFTCIRIVAVTQQFAEAWQEIPDGWKTICVIEFPDGVPTSMDELPTMNAWGESREAVALCSHETLQAIQQNCLAA